MLRSPLCAALCAGGQCPPGKCGSQVSAPQSQAIGDTGTVVLTAAQFQVRSRDRKAVCPFGRLPEWFAGSWRCGQSLAPGRSASPMEREHDSVVYRHFRTLERDPRGQAPFATPASARPSACQASVCRTVRTGGACPGRRPDGPGRGQAHTAAGSDRAERARGGSLLSGHECHHLGVSLGPVRAADARADKPRHYCQGKPAVGGQPVRSGSRPARPRVQADCNAEQ